MTNTYNYAIKSKDNETEALKHLNIDSDSQEVADSFADEELEDYKNGLTVEPEEFEAE